ncbi:FkbM family methyltransferase [Ancylobacter pratisalsi]|nr:FkbM family methyltransferase [Ancylobacter pratisalsi]
MVSLRAAGESHLPWAFGMVSLVADWRVGKNPLSEIQLLPLVVSRGEIAFDVGANRGLYSYWLLRLGAQVFAFEPNPAMGRVLASRFAKDLKSGRMKLFECVVSDDNGVVELHIPVGFSPLATVDGRAIAADVPVDKLMIRAVRLDSFVEGPVDFIKIDVEGHEQKVLDGAAGLIASSRPTLLVEAEERHRPEAVASMRAMLEPLGYEGFFALADGLHPIETFDRARHQNIGALNAAGTAAREPFGYINNFLFIARPSVKERFQGWTPRRLLG